MDRVPAMRFHAAEIKGNTHTTLQQHCAWTLTNHYGNENWGEPLKRTTSPVTPHELSTTLMTTSRNSFHSQPNQLLFLKVSLAFAATYFGPWQHVPTSNYESHTCARFKLPLRIKLPILSDLQPNGVQLLYRALHLYLTTKNFTRARWVGTRPTKTPAELRIVLRRRFQAPCSACPFARDPPVAHSPRLSCPAEKHIGGDDRGWSAEE